MDPQIKRGFLDACVLAALAQGDSYGYRILREVPESLELTESTLYPVLRRLAKSGSLSEYRREYNGRLRKYYSITDQGRAELERAVQDQGPIVEVLEFIRKGATS